MTELLYILKVSQRGAQHLICCCSRDFKKKYLLFAFLDFVHVIVSSNT